MQQSSPPYPIPSTPVGLRHTLPFRPLNSSPLANSPSTSSPVAAAQARRMSQYKALSPATPVATRRCSSTRQERGRSLSAGSYASAGSLEPGNPPPKLSIRDKFKARCLERAVREREKAIKGKRYKHPSSDDYSMDNDESEDEEVIMGDELFRRIMENANRKRQHTYRLSFAYEVGSSFDPNLEDVDSWEKELGASNFADPLRASMRVTASNSADPGSSSMASDEHDEVTPFDLDDAELEAYAEEYARSVAFAEFEDLPAEELFAWSDAEGLENSMESSSHHDADDMDVS